MNSYDVEITLKFEEMFDELDKSMRIITKKELENLPKRNFKREALKGDLAGFYSHHFYKNQYRIIYKIDNKKLIIYAVWVEKKHDQKYGDFKKWLKRNPI